MRERERRNRDRDTETMRSQGDGHPLQTLFSPLRQHLRGSLSWRTVQTLSGHLSRSGLGTWPPAQASQMPTAPPQIAPHHLVPGTLSPTGEAGALCSSGCCPFPVTTKPMGCVWSHGGLLVCVSSRIVSEIVFVLKLQRATLLNGV